MEQKAYNAEYIKQYNRKKIMNFLSKEPLSRAELARRTGLTRSAISIIADELLGYQILIEHGVVAQKRGRSPAPLSLNPDNFCAVGIFLSRMNCQIGLLDISGTCLCTSSIPFDSNKNIFILLDEVADEIKNMLHRFPRAEEKLLGIGVSAPGPIDILSGNILNPPNFEAWHNTALCDELKKRLHYPIYISDKADSLAFYNMRYGSLKNMDNFILLLVDSGVGSGIVTNGKLHRGFQDRSSEIGHISIRYDGKKCSCGNRGCLEIYAAIPNLLADSETAYPSWEAVIHAADNNAADALQLLHTEAEYLTVGITSVINLFNLNTIVLAGDILCGFPYLEQALMSNLQNRTLLKEPSQLRVIASDTRENYQLISAANIVFTANIGA